MKNFSKQILIGIAALAVIAYIGLQLSLNVGTIVDVDHAVYAETSKTISASAYLFRDETVLTSAVSGTSTYFYQDGEKIAVGDNIVAIYTLSSDAAIQSEINELNKKIKILEKSSVTKSYSTSDITRMDESITNSVLGIIRAVDERSLTDAALNRTDLLISLNRRRSILTAVSGFDMQIDACNTRKKELEAMLTGGSAKQSAPVSGYFYSAVDGYERIFTKSLVDTMTIEQYESLSSAVPDPSLLASATGKIVTSSKWYISVALDKRTAIRLTEGKPSSYKYSVTFPYSGDRTVGMTLERSISQTNYDDLMILVFASSELPDGFNYTRSQTVSITEAEYSGLRIPVSSLRMIDGVKGVYALDGNVVIYKTAEPLYEENGYYICALPDKDNISARSKEKLSLYDVVVTAGKGIYVGKILS